jgi:hypothetical protein
MIWYRIKNWSWPSCAYVHLQSVFMMLHEVGQEEAEVGSPGQE